MSKGESALDVALNELERIMGLWKECDLTSKDFQMMLGRLCHRFGKGLPIDKQIDQARGLLRRKGTLSPLRKSTELPPTRE